MIASVSANCKSKIMGGSVILYLISTLLSSFLLESRALRLLQRPPQQLDITPSSSFTSSSSSYLQTTTFPPLAPALFVIGDSSVDCGTNNFLGTFARANHLPYGRDFDTHQPTGRFSNGRIPVDYLGSYIIVTIKTLSLSPLNLIFIRKRQHIHMYTLICLCFQDFNVHFWGQFYLSP